jgi:hypothetical protein
VGTQARAYLHRRGLTDETIRAARLGYHVAERWENPQCWGLPDGLAGSSSARSSLSHSMPIGRGRRRRPGG